jgi:hypothetical protein
MPFDPRDIAMQTNSTIVSVFILFPVLQEGVMNCADRESLVIKNLSLAFNLVCLILFSIWHHLLTINLAANVAWYFPLNKTGLHQK